MLPTSEDEVKTNVRTLKDLLSLYEKTTLAIEQISFDMATYKKEYTQTIAKYSNVAIPVHTNLKLSLGAPSLDSANNKADSQRLKALSSSIYEMEEELSELIEKSNDLVEEISAYDIKMKQSIVDVHNTLNDEIENASGNYGYFN